MDNKDIYLEASKALAEEDYEEALKLYKQVVELEPTNEACLTILTQVYIKLEKYEDALEMADRALKLFSSNSGTYLKKGIAEYYLKKYTSAKASFEQGLHLKAGDSKLKDWLQKCCKMIPSGPPISTSAPSLTPSSSSLSSSSPLPTDSNKIKDLPKVTEEAMKTKFDWYQTETHVVVTLLIKNISQDKFQHTLTTNCLSCMVDLPTGSKFTKEWRLQHQVLPQQSSVKIFSTKIEIKMKKEEGVRWSALESLEKNEGVESSSKKYPSSSHHTKDWDKLATQLKDDKEEGDAALNQLFQQIYSDGTDETKKAMMKSFSESGGTVLSTNWKDIGEKNVECKPPDGMEYKKWGY